MQAQPSSVLPDPALLVNLLQALKDSTLASIDSIIAEREKTVLQYEEYLRSPPSEGGWNFRKFFLTKVSEICLLITIKRSTYIFFTFIDRNAWHAPLKTWD